MPLWDHVARAISQATDQPFEVQERREVGGGCINRGFRVTGGREAYFVKLNDRLGRGAFAAEAEALSQIAATGTIRVPLPVCHGECGTTAFLVLEHLDLAPGRSGAGARLGRRLAGLHRHAGRRYGWHRDNRIGATPQSNRPADSWCEFWRERRLRPQLERAYGNGFAAALRADGTRLLEGLDVLLAGHEPPPSLVHGDLWGGNAGVLASGTPVVFDPAAYHGDREVDLAMTELFGGFAPDFYGAYREAYPLPEGYGRRKTLYNLYHMLNHLNLFGSGYLAQAAGMLGDLVRGVR